MKKLHFFVSSVVVSLAFGNFQKVYGMDYAASFFAPRDSIKQAVISGLAPQILPPIDGETISTKSQRPACPKPQGYYEVSVDGKPIRENCKDNQEKVLGSIIPGKDGRIQILQTDEWPNSVHGMVYMTFRSGSGAWGSGTLIAPNLVLTAAHNLYDTDIYNGQPVGRAKEVKFYPAKNGREIPFKEQSVRDFYYPEEYTKDGSEDYGLLVLDNPVGEMTGYFGVSVLHPDKVKVLKINVTGYPGDKVAGKDKVHEMWGMEGRATNIDQDFIEYEIDTYRGQSGSGVWYQEGENYFVTGIHVLGDNIRPVNKATLLTKDRYKKIREWAENSIKQFIIENIRDGIFQNVDYADLSYKHIGNFGVITLCEYARFLNTVNLSGNGINDSACGVLAQHPTITNLNLNYNYISNRGAGEFAQNPRLLSLDISWNCIDDEGAINLLKSKALINLNLSHNKIEDAKSVLIALNENTILKTLDFICPYEPSKETVVYGAAGGLIQGLAVAGVGVVMTTAVIATGGAALPVVGATGTLMGSVGAAAGGAIGYQLTNMEKYQKNQIITKEIIEQLYHNHTITSLSLSDNMIDGDGRDCLRVLLERNRN